MLGRGKAVTAGPRPGPAATEPAGTTGHAAEPSRNTSTTTIKQD